MQMCIAGGYTLVISAYTLMVLSVEKTFLTKAQESSLEQICDQIFFLSGNFIAHIGANSWSAVMEYFKVGQVNKNRESLLDLCLSFVIVIPSTILNG